MIHINIHFSAEWIIIYSNFIITLIQFTGLLLVF